MTMKKRILSGVGALALAAGLSVSLSACDAVHTNSALAKDQAQSTRRLGAYEANQPAPMANFSQYRQALINIEGAQIHGAATTTFFFNMGATVPFKSCPSIGYPIASTSQLTNPEQTVQQYAGNNTYNTVTVPQFEPNGVYTGDSSGTYVVCVVNGQHEVNYWEGWVESEGGAAHWDAKAGKIVDDGAPTVTDAAGK